MPSMCSTLTGVVCLLGFKCINMISLIFHLLFAFPFKLSLELVVLSCHQQSFSVFPPYLKIFLTFLLFLFSLTIHVHVCFDSIL